jgi:hypothetical protein
MKKARYAQSVGGKLREKGMLLQRRRVYGIIGGLLEHRFLRVILILLTL